MFGGLAVVVAMDSDKQIEAIVYYPKNTRWSMLNTMVLYTGESALHNDKCIVNGGHLSCNSKQ